MFKKRFDDSKFLTGTQIHANHLTAHNDLDKDI